MSPCPSNPNHTLHPPPPQPQLLHEAVHNEDDMRWGPSVDEAGPEAQLLLEELMERQRMVGALDSSEYMWTLCTVHVPATHVCTTGGYVGGNAQRPQKESKLWQIGL